jgi:hypothetical protein
MDFRWFGALATRHFVPPFAQEDDFPASFNGEMSVNGGPDQLTNSSGPVTTLDQVFSTYHTEILSMNLSGTSPFGPYMIRESPTLTSLGETRITDIGGGMFHVDSFFDVFTELSVDGGNSWIPSQGSSHINLTSPSPEPATVVLLGLGMLGLMGLRRSR